MSDQLEKAKIEMLKAATRFQQMTKLGREISQDRIQKTREAAKTSQQFADHLTVLQIEASHTLATLMVNQMQSGKSNERESFDLIMRGIGRELQFIRQELCKPDKPKE